MEVIPLPPEEARAHDELVNKTMDVNGKRCLEQFKLLKVIGRGSYAKVFQVDDLKRKPE